MGRKRKERRQKRREERKQRRQERRSKRGGKGLFGRILDGAKKGAQFAVLLPFQVAMRAILRKKGVTPEKGIAKLSQQFYNVVILKKSTYEMYEPEHLAGEVVQAIVKGVIEFFKGLKKKKESGEPLSDAEEKALNAAEKATEEVINPAKEVIKEAAQEEAKSKLFMPLALGAAALLLILLLGNKKK